MHTMDWRVACRLVALLLACGLGSACGGDSKEEGAEGEEPDSGDSTDPEDDAGEPTRDSGDDAGIDPAGDGGGGGGGDARSSDAEPGTLQYSLDLLDPDMRAVVEKMNGKPIETLAPEEARIQPTPMDALKATLQATGASVEPEAVGEVSYRSVPGPLGVLSVALRVYTPAAPGPHPIILYYHGGGWVLASVETYDITARALTNAVPAVVVAVEFRKGPEAKFPAAHEDAFAAYQWILQSASVVGGDPTRIAVAGESAGGNLAANVAIRARDEGLQPPLHTLLVYPIASTNMDTPSYIEHANAKPLNRAMIPWFNSYYFQTPADGNDPRISLVNANLGGLGATTIINADVDPLRSDGEELAAKLKAAGVPVVQKTYYGVTHEFFGMGAAVRAAKDAMTFARDRLRESLKR
jgi:acetyl esterase